MLLWMDSFDHYGTGAMSGTTVTGATSKMADGIYSDLESSVRIAGSPGDYPFTRTGNCFLAVANNNSMFRRPLGYNLRVVGFGGAYFFNTMPQGTSNFALISFRDANNNVQLSVGMDTTGALLIRRDSDSSSGAIIHTNTEPDLVSGAWQHIEARIDCDAAAGAIEVRVNGITKINLTGINARPHTDASGGVGRVSQIAARSNNTTGLPGFAVDDIYAWGVLGTMGEANVDFIGDRKVYTLLPEADTSVADYDFVGNTDGGYACLPTPDDDTSYIKFDTPVGSVENLGDFTLENLPSTVAAITAVQTYVRSKKTDAGVADMQVSMLAEGDIGAGEDRPITTAYTYWMDVFELNPHTGAPWTPSELNAAGLRIARTD